MEEIRKIVSLQQKIAPEFAKLLQERYDILQYIRYHQPVGRRVLAGRLALSECGVRNGVKVLKDAGLICLSGLGMSLTDAGRRVAGELDEYMSALSGLHRLERWLEEALGVREARVVPGDSAADSSVFAALGRAAALALRRVLTDGMVVAVSGGSTMAAVAAAAAGELPRVLVVPTRGGSGGQVEHQANHVAAALAGNLGGRYRLLHIPELLSDAAFAALKAADPSIGEIEALLCRADVLLHSIGRADAMAERRGYAPKVAARIRRLGAGESLGHCFDSEGKCIYTYCSHGFRLNDLAGVGRKIAVAGGGEKAAAIIAVTRAGSNDILVVDEAAATAIQSIINSEKSRRTF